jgi:hypothetical protein
MHILTQGLPGDTEDNHKGLVRIANVMVETRVQRCPPADCL